jgi:hypothetical protein
MRMMKPPSPGIAATVSMISDGKLTNVSRACRTNLVSSRSAAGNDIGEDDAASACITPPRALISARTASPSFVDVAPPPVVLGPNAAAESADIRSDARSDAEGEPAVVRCEGRRAAAPGSGWYQTVPNQEETVARGAMTSSKPKVSIARSTVMQLSAVMQIAAGSGTTASGATTGSAGTVEAGTSELGAMGTSTSDSTVAAEASWVAEGDASTAVETSGALAATGAATES